MFSNSTTASTYIVNYVKVSNSISVTLHDKMIIYEKVYFSISFCSKHHNDTKICTIWCFKDGKTIFHQKLHVLHNYVNYQTYCSTTFPEHLCPAWLNEALVPAWMNEVLCSKVCFDFEYSSKIYQGYFFLYLILPKCSSYHRKSWQHLFDENMEEKVCVKHFFLDWLIRFAL